MNNCLQLDIYFKSCPFKNLPRNLNPRDLSKPVCSATEKQCEQYIKQFKSNPKPKNKKTIKDQVMAILKNNNTFLTCRNIQHIIHSKSGKMPKDGTVSSILYKLDTLLEKQEGIGVNKECGYKLAFPTKNQPKPPKPIRTASNSIMELEI
jgi:hypothetical protein